MIENIFLFKFQAAITIMNAIGSKQMSKIVIQYPSVILPQLFSYWSIGPYKNHANKICISYWHTWINAIITTFGGMVFTFQCLENKELRFWFGSHPYTFGFIFVFILYISSVLSLALFQFIDKYQLHCFPFCLKNCIPLTEITILDVSKKQEEHNLQNSKFQDTMQSDMNESEETIILQRKEDIQQQRVLFKDSQFLNPLQSAKRKWRELVIAIVFLFLIPIITILFVSNLVFSTEGNFFTLTNIDLTRFLPLNKKSVCSNLWNSFPKK